MRHPPGGVDPAWLDLRGTADTRARTSFAGDLAGGLAEYLAPRAPGPVGGSGMLRLVDVGAGTGTGARWLRDQLTDRLQAPAPVRQDWRLVDRDAHLLAAAGPAGDGWARGVVADVADLPALLADEPADVVTCQALVDVLTAPDVDAMVASAVESGAAVLLALSVTGEVTLSPVHHDDALVADAFDAHQRRAGRLGPDGGAYAADALRRRGYTVTVVATPWLLDAADTDLLRAWLQGRAEAAVEQRPTDADRVRRWYRTRDEQARRGELSASVGHVDVLGLPPRPAGSR